MRTIIRYIPFDDDELEFDSEAECKEYERKQKMLMQGCHFFDSNNNEFAISENNLCDDLNHAYDYSIKLVFDSIESKEWLNEMIGFCSRFERKAKDCLSFHIEDAEWVEDNYKDRA